MKVIPDVRETDEVFPNLVLTIGSFDGVHLGHRRILDELIRSARALHGVSALMSLRPHPRQFFFPENAPNILTSDATKEHLLAEAGVEVLFVLPFNREVASLAPQEFLENIVLARCYAKKLVVGHDFSFGRNAQGNYEYLAEAAPRYGFEVIQVPQLVVQGERVSSTLIRERVLQGEVDTIEPFLGRKYSIVGDVVAGRGVGRKLGFPTANIEPHHNAVPAHGVYMAEAVVNGHRYRAAVNVGVAPTVRHEDMMIEAHLLDFAGDLLRKPIEVIFHKRLRPEKRFESYKALTEAIARDVAEIRAYFAGSDDLSGRIMPSLPGRNLIS